jgi:phenylpyruvate tautomerase PptA (4-oxalocrotonate tautomerase family)
MIDVYAASDTFGDTRRLATDLATALMRIEGVPDIPMFRDNTAAFIHEMSPEQIANVNGSSACVRVQVLTNAGALNRDKQLELVQRFTEMIAAAAAPSASIDRTWVLLTEAVEGGWGLWGHAHTNDELVARARAELSKVADDQG